MFLRYNLMREKTKSMYHDHEGFRSAFQEIWENAMDVDARKRMMELVMKRCVERESSLPFCLNFIDRVDDNLPPPKYKALMYSFALFLTFAFPYVNLRLLGKSCPEFFEDELVLGKTISMVDFMDAVVDGKENSKKYPFHDKIKVRRV